MKADWSTSIHPFQKKTRWRENDKSGAPFLWWSLSKKYLATPSLFISQEIREWFPPFYSPRSHFLPIFKSNGGLVAQVDGFTRHTRHTQPQPTTHQPPHLKEIQGLLPTMTFATGTNNTVEGNGIESHVIGLQLIKETFNKGQTKWGDGSKGSMKWSKF